MIKTITSKRRMDKILNSKISGFHKKECRPITTQEVLNLVIQEEKINGFNFRKGYFKC